MDSDLEPPGPGPKTLEIREASWPDDAAIVRALFEEYARSIGVDLCFQGFTSELASLPGAYAPPSGRLLLAFSGPDPIACIALRELPGRSPATGASDAGAGAHRSAGEVKRLYVRPAARGVGVGRALVRRLVALAEASGYEELYLDTLASMEAAIAVYRGEGFQPTEAYYENPLEGVLYFVRRTREGPRSRSRRGSVDRRQPG